MQSSRTWWLSTSTNRLSISVLIDRWKRSTNGFSHGERGGVLTDWQPKCSRVPGSQWPKIPSRSWTIAQYRCSESKTERHEGGVNRVLGGTKPLTLRILRTDFLETLIPISWKIIGYSLSSPTLITALHFDDQVNNIFVNRRSTFRLWQPYDL